jgi:hypothetical protein
MHILYIIYIQEVLYYLIFNNKIESLNMTGILLI